MKGGEPQHDLIGVSNLFRKDVDPILIKYLDLTQGCIFNLYELNNYLNFGSDQQKNLIKLFYTDILELKGLYKDMLHNDDIIKLYVNFFELINEFQSKYPYKLPEKPTYISQEDETNILNHIKSSDDEILGRIKIYIIILMK